MDRLRRGSNAIRKRAASMVGMMKLDDGDAKQRLSPRVAPDAPIEDLDVQPGVAIEDALKIFQVPALAAVSETDRRLILVRLKPVTFAAEAPIIEEGCPAPAAVLTFITKGHVVVNVGELKVREMKAPFYVGEGGVFTDKEASAAVTAVEDCSGYQLAKADCKALYNSSCVAIKLIERDMLIRAVEREIQRCEPFMFGEVRAEGLFMSSILESAERTYSSEALQFVLAVEELKKLVGGDGHTADSMKRIKAQVLQDIEHIYTTHLLEAAPEHGNLGVSLEINLNKQQREYLYSSRDRISEAAAADPLALREFADLFQKEYKTNVRMIRQQTIPAFLKSPEYEEFKLILYPLPKETRAFARETISYSNWILKQKCKANAVPETSPPPSQDGATAPTNGDEAAAAAKAGAVAA